MRWDKAGKGFVRYYSKRIHATAIRIRAAFDYFLRPKSREKLWRLSCQRTLQEIAHTTWTDTVSPAFGKSLAEVFRPLA